jgi:hypothetical protein
MMCVISLCTTRTSKSPIWGSPRTVASASASAAGDNNHRSPSWSYSPLATIKALRRSLTVRMPCGMPTDEQPNQLLLISSRRLRKLQHITINLHPHHTAHTVPARQPRPDG